MRTGITKYALLVSCVAGFTAFNGTAATSDDARSSASSSSSTAVKADHKTVSFLKEAARGNDLEIALAELGSRKAQNSELKSFCQMLQQDHTQAAQQLQPIAQKYGVAIDQSLKHKENREVTKLEKESGANFDREFATLMLKDHQKDIEKYQDAANKLQEADVKQYAQTILPKLREHFQHAETVAKAVGVDQSTISSYSKKVGEAMGGAGSEDKSSTGSGSSFTNSFKTNEVKSSSSRLGQ